MYDFDKIIPRENTDCFKYDYRKEFFGNPDVLPMWVADMDIETPPFIIDALKERLNHKVFGYTLRGKDYVNSICAWNKTRNHWNINPEWVSFSPGIVPAINLLVMAFTNPGDKIMVQTPVYFPFFSAVKNHNRVLVKNPLIYKNHSYEMDFDHLEDQLKQGVKMVILCNPHNPVARVWKKSELEKFANLCLQYKALIVSDEIHSDLIFPGNTHIPLATLSEDIAANTITCMAPSKTFNLAGLSTSYLVTSNSKLRKTYEKILDDIHVGSGNIFGNIALTAAYKHGGPWVDQLMDYFQGTVTWMQEYIQNKISGLQMINPEGTYLIWLDFNEMGISETRLKKLLIENAGLGLSEGTLFGDEGSGFQRINIGCPRETVKKALKNLHHALNKGKF